MINSLKGLISSIQINTTDILHPIIILLHQAKPSFGQL